MTQFVCRFTGRALSEKSELLSSWLSEQGFHGFMEEAQTLFAYIASDELDEDGIRQLLSHKSLEGVNYAGSEIIPEQNWNAQWESDYEAVKIGERCQVRAPFHLADPAVEHDIVIMPRMSFGTAHHETTYLMIGILLDHNVQGKHVLDMGCGTAVLGILASRLGAAQVLAVDNDQWACDNAGDNVKTNHINNITVAYGDAGKLAGMKFDLILANINRNILLADMTHYHAALHCGGRLIMSGFYIHDFDQIREKATKLGFALTERRIKNNWVAAAFQLE